MLYDSLKKPDAAAEHYRKALERDQNAIIAANNLAWLYAVKKKGQSRRSGAARSRCGPEEPELAGFVDTLGWVYYKKGLYAVAVEQLQKAVALDDAAAKKVKCAPESYLSLPSGHGA